MLQCATFIATLLLLTVHSSLQEGCVINVSKMESDQFGDTQALVLSYDTPHEILYPPLTNRFDDLGISLEVGEVIIISCPTGLLYVHPDLPPTTVHTATCNQDSQLESEGYIVDFHNYVKCRAGHLETITIGSKRCSENTNSVSVEVGFDVGVNDIVVPLIEVCFDNATKANIYSHQTVYKYIGFRHAEISDAPQIQDDQLFDLPNVDLFNVYTTDVQKITINRLLGLPDDSDKYIDFDGPIDTFLCKKEVANSDSFLYEKLQLGVFRYINVVPLWCGSFRGFNVLLLEDDLDDYASDNQVDLDVYTGTYDVLKYPHEETGEDVELFLYSDEVHGSIIPVPALYWKVAYEPVSQNAAAFVFVNDAHKELEDIVKICEDIQDDLSYLTWYKDNVRYTFAYACAYEDLAKVIPLPELEVKGILT